MSKEKQTPNNFDVLKRMSNDNMDIKIAPAENFKRAQTGKKSWGELTIAVDNETLTNLGMTENYTFCLLIYNVKDFAKAKTNCVNSHAALVKQRDDLKEALEKIATHEIEMYQKLFKVLSLTDEQTKEYKGKKSHSCRIAKAALAQCKEKE